MCYTFNIMITVILNFHKQIVSDENKTIKFPFNFLRLPPAPPPAVLKGKVRKFLVLVRDWKEREARIVSIATKSERTIWFKATTRSARAKLIKILWILFIQCSNFVQKTPPVQKSASFEMRFLLSGEEEADCSASVRDSKRFSHIFEELCSEKMGNLHCSRRERIPPHK